MLHLKCPLNVFSVLAFLTCLSSFVSQQWAQAHAAGGGGGGDGRRDGRGNDLPEAAPECGVEFHDDFFVLVMFIVFVGGLCRCVRWWAYGSSSPPLYYPLYTSHLI